MAEYTASANRNIGALLLVIKEGFKEAQDVACLMPPEMHHTNAYLECVITKEIRQGVHQIALILAQQAEDR